MDLNLRAKILIKSTEKNVHYVAFGDGSGM